MEDYQIEGITVAVTNMDEMLDFYSHVFSIDFEEKEMYDSKLYAGTWKGNHLLFCPASIAGITATQNRHQLHIVVSDLREVIERVERHGGRTMSEIDEEDFPASMGVYDPDGNSLVIRQKDR